MPRHVAEAGCLAPGLASRWSSVTFWLTFVGCEGSGHTCRHAGKLVTVLI